MVRVTQIIYVECPGCKHELTLKKCAECGEWFIVDHKNPEGDLVCFECREDNKEESHD